MWNVLLRRPSSVPSKLSVQEMRPSLPLIHKPALSQLEERVYLNIQRKKKALFRDTTLQKKKKEYSKSIAHSSALIVLPCFFTKPFSAHLIQLMRIPMILYFCKKDFQSVR